MASCAESLDACVVVGLVVGILERFQAKDKVIGLVGLWLRGDRFSGCVKSFLYRLFKPKQMNVNEAVRASAKM